MFAIRPTVEYIQVLYIHAGCVLAACAEWGRGGGGGLFWYFWSSLVYSYHFLSFLSSFRFSSFYGTAWYYTEILKEPLNPNLLAIQCNSGIFLNL